MSKDDAIRAVIENWARAVSAGDRAAIFAHHATDLVMFDFPGTVRGLDTYDRTWDFFFKNPRGPVSFVPRYIAVTAAEDVAFASCLVHCDGTSALPTRFSFDHRAAQGRRRMGDISESPAFVGRAVVALAQDPDVSRWNGKSLSSGQLAKVYGFTDLDGSRPNA